MSWLAVEAALDCCAPNARFEPTAAGALVCGCEDPKAMSGWLGAALLAGGGLEAGAAPAGAAAAEDPPKGLLPAAEPPKPTAAVAAVAVA